MTQKPTYEELEQRIKKLEKAESERKQAKETLQAREVFLDRVIDQSPFATWISDAEGTLQRANPALKRFLNLTDGQLVGKYNVLKDPVTERQGLLPLFRTVFEEGRSISFTCNWDGNDIPTLDLKGSNSVSIEAAMFPIHNPAGELTNVVLHWIDITDRKEAEEALRESEEKYRSMMESMKAAVYICSPDFRVEYMNPTMIKRTGRDATGEVCHKAINDLDDDDELLRLLSQDQELLRGAR